MKTQSVSQMSAIQSMANGRASKTSQSTFDSFMPVNNSKVEGKNAVSETSPKEFSEKNSVALSSSREEFNQHKLTLTDTKDSTPNLETVELDDVELQVVQFLKDTYGLSEEDIVDVLEQLGLAPIDLAVFMALESITIQPVPIENIKAFIMEIHGVDDPNLFLVSDQMSGELNEVMQGIQDILSQELGLDIKNLSQNDMPVLQSFAEKMGLLTGEAADVSVQEVNAAEGKTISPDTAEKGMTEAVTAETGQEIPVVVEMSEESGTSNAFSKEMQSQSEPVREVQVQEPESPIGAFVERLSESFEQVRQNDTATPQVTMNDIVQQVVNHIRIRVLPQTTSMELQLNPESLGRVNLNVTSQNGTATATLTVQNAAAKEALESQITVLRENLESQGLKVEAVEVNVSEFGFKHPEDSNASQYQQQKKSQSQNRRFRFDAAREVEEDTVETSEDRQDGNSVVDYTA